MVNLLKSNYAFSFQTQSLSSRDLLKGFSHGITVTHPIATFRVSSKLTISLIANPIHKQAFTLRYKIFDPLAFPCRINYKASITASQRLVLPPHSEPRSTLPYPYDRKLHAQAGFSHRERTTFDLHNLA